MSKVEWMPSRFVYSLESPSILLMLNFAHDGRMFTQLNKASIPHTHAHLSTRHRMATKSGHCLYFYSVWHVSMWRSTCQNCQALIRVDGVAVVHLVRPPI